MGTYMILKFYNLVHDANGEPGNLSAGGPPCIPDLIVYVSGDKVMSVLDWGRAHYGTVMIEEV